MVLGNADKSDAGYDPQVFAATLKNLVALGPANQTKEIAELLTERIHTFGYLRGLDGIAAHGGKTEADPPRTADQKETSKIPGMLERAEGPSLLDQIRTVGIRLREQDALLRENGKRIHAIGILGSDYYDKQLVLQTLRAAFPDVVFFTTDLDARYLFRDDQAWNRNLVVGSSFGFELNKLLQKDVPPFRDVYSTSTFLAGLLALGRCPNGPDGKACQLLNAAVDKVVKSRPLHVKPLIFEIGISRAHRLETGKGAELQSEPLLHPETENPRRFQKWPKKVVIFLLIVLLVALAVSERARARGLLLVGVLVAGYGCLLLVEVLFAAEPTALLEGVSARGTELLRMYIFGLAVALFVVVRMKIERALESIRLRFEDKPQPPCELSLSQWLYIGSGFRRADEESCASQTTVGEGEESSNMLVREKTVEAAAIWKYYCALQRGEGQGLWWNRQVIRVLAMTTAAMAIVALFAAAGPGHFEFPLVPLRGGLVADKILRYLTLFVLAFACFWTRDHVRLCVDLVDRLASRRTVWPANRQNIRSAERRGLELIDIGDYLDIRVIGPLTQALSWTILYPFLLLALYILSRAAFFDCWTWPFIVSCIVVVLLASILLSAARLQRTARRARESTLKILRLSQLEAISLGAASPKHKARAEQFGVLIREVETFDQGALGPWTSNPIIGALLLPFGGASAASLIDSLLQVGW